MAFVSTQRNSDLKHVDEKAEVSRSAVTEPASPRGTFLGPLDSPRASPPARAWTRGLTTAPGSPTSPKRAAPATFVSFTELNPENHSPRSILRSPPTSPRRPASLNIQVPRSPVRTLTTVSSPASPSRKGSPIFSPLPSPQTSLYDSPILASHFGSPPRPAHSPLNSPLPSPLPASRMHYDSNNPNHPPPINSPPRKYGSPISSPLPSPIPSPKEPELLARTFSGNSLREASSNNLLAELEDASISSLKSPDASLSRSESLSPLHALPRFHFPAGVSRPEDRVAVPIILERFEQHPQGLTCAELIPVTLQIGLSSYWSTTLFAALEQNQRVTLDAFLKFWWSDLQMACQHARLFRIIARAAARHEGRTRDYLIREDFELFVHEIAQRHPGLEFLKSTPEFQSRYCQTVIGRIFYVLNRAGNEKLTLGELKRGDFANSTHALDSEPDINKLNAFFSYEHFYVIYCKFWELDADHDAMIGVQDLLKYDDYAMSSLVVERIFQQIPRKFLCEVPGKMGYLDFIVFLISEVDKSSPVAMDYWFRVADLDGDDSISLLEIETLFREQMERITELSQEEVSVADLVCQLLDSVSPRDPCRIVKKDLYNCQLQALFFDALVNCNKFLASESRDVVKIRHIRETPDLTDWDRYAIMGYCEMAEPEDDGTNYDQENVVEPVVTMQVDTPTFSTRGGRGGGRGGGGGGGEQKSYSGGSSSQSWRKDQTNNGSTITCRSLLNGNGAGNSWGNAASSSSFGGHLASGDSGENKQSRRGGGRRARRRGEQQPSQPQNVSPTAGWNTGLASVQFVGKSPEKGAKGAGELRKNGGRRKKGRGGKLEQ